jgi:hypothetical protein
MSSSTSEGRFAFYAHMQPGNLRVKPGNKVTTGQVLGLLGNSGNTDAPHLHFHVMDGASPLMSNGLPYVFTSFTGEGRATDEQPLFSGGAVTIDPNAFSGPHRSIWRSSAFPTDGAGQRIGMAQDVFAANLVVKHVETEGRLHLCLTIQLSLKAPDPSRCCQAHRQSPSPRHLRKHARSQGPSLMIDSPGGPVMSLAETADTIARASRIKPTFAIVDGLMASASFWLGSQAASRPPAVVPRFAAINEIRRALVRQ